MKENGHKSIKRVVAEGAFWLSGASIVTRIIWLLTSLIVLDALTVREFGIVELMFSVTASLSIFSLPGMYNIVLTDVGVENGNKRYDNVRILLKQYFIYLLISSVFAWAIMFFGSDFITLKFSTLAGNLIKIMAFSFLIGPFWAVSQVLLMLHSKFTAVAIHQLVMAFSKLMIIVGLLYTHKLSIAGVLVAHVAMDYVAFLVIFPTVMSSLFSLKKGGVGGKVSLLKIIAKHGKWAIFGAYLNDLTKTFRLWLMKIMIGTEAVGLYSAALGIFSQIRSVLPLQKILSSIIPQHNSNSVVFNKLVMKGIKYNFLGTFLFGLLAALFVPVLIFTLLPHYIPAIILFEIMLISMLPISVGGILSIVFFAIRKQDSLFFANALRFLITVLSLPFLIFFFGLNGAAFELTVAGLFFVFIRIKMLKKDLPNVTLSLNTLMSYDELDKQILSVALTKIKSKFF